MKICKACGAEKPRTEYHKDRSKSDGLNFYCKPCTIERQRTFVSRPPKHRDPGGMKTCQHCKELRPVANFHAAAATWDGLQKRCKACNGELHDAWRRKNLPKMAADQKRRREADPERFADYLLKQNYGLPPGTYQKMLDAQDGRCAICKTTDTGRHRRFHVDHCRGTEKVRGLLCHGCNVSLGHFKHSPGILSAAITYLAESGGVG